MLKLSLFNRVKKVKIFCFETPPYCFRFKYTTKLNTQPKIKSLQRFFIATGIERTWIIAFKNAQSIPGPS